MFGRKKEKEAKNLKEVEASLIANDELNDDNAQTAGDIEISQAESSLAAFTRRPLPTDKQVEEFEEAIEEEVHEEEVEESLNEIYKDDNGDIVDVKKFKILKKHSLFFWFFSLLLFVGFFGGGGYAFYEYVYKNFGTDSTAVDFFVDAKTEVLANEEFFYTLKYKNKSQINIKNVRVAANYPRNFIFSDSLPAPIPDKNSVWEFANLIPGQEGEIKIKGRLIGQKDELGIVSAELTYVPENFSSEFKKETTLTTVIKDVGLDIGLDYVSAVLVGKEDEAILRFRAKENNFINNFRLTIEPQENVEIIGVKNSDDPKQAKFTLIRPGVWQIDEVLIEEHQLPIRFKILQKTEDVQKINFSLDLVGRENEFYKFFTKEIAFDVMKSDLNLNLIINGGRSDQGIGAGDTLNYSIVYANRGEAEMKDVVIMVVLESDFLDWDSLVDANSGKRSRNTITWTKNEIKDLESLRRNQEGVIDFSVALKNLGEIDTTKNYQVKSYAHFSVGEAEEAAEGEDNRSNLIINKINSNLRLDEAVRYFSEENIPVGEGPNPPKVGEITSYKVYWRLENSLHELDSLEIRTKLPAYVNWDEKHQSSVGSIRYESDSREVVWSIGRLPITVQSAEGEFGIRIMPTEKDLNKIMVLLSGSSVNAVDSETGADINFSIKAKTTKLEGDEIGGGDGMVE